MLRTIEALFVVVIVLSSFLGVQHFAVIPSPRTSSSIGLEEMANSLLKSLDEDASLTKTIFGNDPESWIGLQKVLEASLPPNIVYELSVYPFGDLQNPLKTIRNFGGNLPSDSGVASYTVTSPAVTITTTPEKISEKGNKITLYVLNCEDANGWWITGYTSQTLARNIYDVLSPYFGNTVLINSTYQLGQLLNGTSFVGNMASPQDAVIINPFGEAVPIAAGYYSRIGFDAINRSYAKYLYEVGKLVNYYNWTWVSVVGYPLFYVSNTVTFANSNNTWGIYGMKLVDAAGFNCFLEGLNNVSYVYNKNWIAQPSGSSYVVDLTAKAKEMTNYYGIYPEYYQTSTRALSLKELSKFNITNIFESFTIVTYSGGERYILPYSAGAIFSHIDNGVKHGSVLSLGLAKTPDIRMAVLGVLMFYNPRIYRSEFGARDSTRIVILQLGQIGGD